MRDTVVDAYYTSAMLFHVSAKDSDVSMKYKDGVGETAEWINQPESPYNMRFYIVHRSDYNNRRAGTDEERETANHVIESVLSDMENREGMTSKKLRDEVITRLARKRLKWMYIAVRRGDGHWSGMIIPSRYLKTDGAHYSIFIYLLN